MKIKKYESFRELLQDLENDIKIVNGLIIENLKKYKIDRKINGNWEMIFLSQYKNSEDLILVETNDFSFTVSRWNDIFSISEQITKNTK
jgi:hypothetical protein|tara:strand:- start:223 stop:489 length:267 start_codon:yes stop_codon:yes gene_type:complete